MRNPILGYFFAKPKKLDVTDHMCSHPLSEEKIIIKTINVVGLKTKAARLERDATSKLKLDLQVFKMTC